MGVLRDQDHTLLCCFCHFPAHGELPRVDPLKSQISKHSMEMGGGAVN